MRAAVLPLADPGYATLRITELEASPDGLTISIQRQQGPESHLADDGWRRSETWLSPDRVVRIRDTLEFQLGPEICDRLAGIATIRLRVQEPDIGVVGTTVVAWPQMLTSGAVDPLSRSHDDTVRLRGRPVEEPPPPPAPPFEPPPEPEPMPELRAEREPLPPVEPEGGGRTKWMIATVIVLLLAGAGYYAYTNFIESPQETVASATPPTAPAPAPAPAPPVATPAPTPAAPKKSVRETVAEYLATNPAPDAMMAKGREFAQAGEMNAAFLVWRRAAEAGSVPAQVELASFYDPLETPAKAGFTPDGARAADWYERAALAGNPEAQRKYGLLLAKGGAGLPADQGRAKAWLQQAAAQNDAEAKKALESLPK
ncbi:MAG: sel1 repeat family protein [Reyranella sp.]|uniref:tetratricopeptide repeat protein n=1 Tax=Reyranella sp. TaxID=1929291 RepID=UPI001AC9C309|nr:tetratricopeptide repeat protein [Reyranella sp.]MBN9091182.1 sel1 repeat family protein [Reyranella sp.]